VRNQQICNLALTIAKVATLIQGEIAQRVDAHSQDTGDLAIVRAPVAAAP
jgi:hypothetical protein